MTPVTVRTMCIIATALDAAGLIIGGGLWFEYQNWLCVAVMLIFQLAAVTVWLLTKGERPRWFWAVNVWFLSVIPAVFINEVLWLVIQHIVGILYLKDITISPPNDLIWATPFAIWLLICALVTWLTLRRSKS